MAERTDEEVARQVQAGDSEAFGVLVDRYEPKLLRYAHRFLFGRDDAQDVVQEAFLKAYANIQGFDTKRTFSPWIYRVAHNVFVTALGQRQAATVPLPEGDTLWPQPVASETADSETERRLLREMLDASLATLDAKYREPLVLHYFEDMDYESISEILHIPVSTVGVRLNRGRALLRTRIPHTPEQ